MRTNLFQRGSVGAPLVFTEIGIGNPSFISTEVEWPDGYEKRYKGFVKGWRLKSVYIRLWIGRKVYISDLREGFKGINKPQKSFKVLLGLSGEPVNSSLNCQE